MSQTAYAFIGLTALVAALVAVLVFAVLRFASAARDARQSLREHTSESAFMAAALEDAMRKLKEQERASTARAEASERLSSEIVASLTAGLLVTDLNGVVQILNPAGQRLLAVPGVTGEGHYRDVLARVRPLTTVIDECLSIGQPIVRRSLELPEGAGASHIGVTVSPLFDGRGALHGAICLFTDLSAVVELEDQLRLKDSLARLGELTAGIAHEFRNGLATIHGYSRLMDPDALPQNYQPYLQGIRQETESLGQVVTNFLTFARPAQLTLTPVDLGALVERAADEVRHDVDGRGGTVRVRGEFPEIEADEVLLRQAFSNLLRNAAEACTSAGLTPALEVEGAVDEQQRHVRVSFSDNGPGIDPSARDRIFRPFFTTKSHGTGLGLALVQKIIVTHNGRVTASNGPRGGALFQVVLPLRGRH